MLIYVIPLILLIIVLIVFKKRQDAQGSDKANAAKTAKNKKLATASKAAPQKAKVVEDIVPQKQEPVALSAELRQKIEGLIQERNFFAAEAQINQALKKDNRQHELYLLLLDIHILQKDEFAISQLINHIRSLNLDDVLVQAEAKKEAFEESLHVKKDTIDFPSAQPTAVPVDNSAAFEQLSPTHTVDDQAFDALQQETKPEKAVFTPQPAQHDIQPLEFNFEPSLQQESTAAPVQEPEQLTSGLDFQFSKQPEKTESTSTVEPELTTPVFDLKLDVDVPAEPTATPSFDFKIDAEKSAAPEVAPESATESIQPLDFSFTVDSTTPVAEQAPSTPTTPEFDLSTIAPTAFTETPAVLDTPSFDFKLDSVADSTSVAAQIPSTESVDANDPLVQSFPELSSINEIRLNFELAQQYIDLGAYDAARELLAEKEAEYTPQERTQVDELLNKIAS